MKVSSDKKTPDFTPFDVTLTVESIEEASKLYAIFNHPHIVGALGWAIGDDEQVGEEIRNEIIKHVSVRSITEQKYRSAISDRFNRGY